MIKLPETDTEEDHLQLLGLLNSSTACFWLKQVGHNKGGPGGGARTDDSGMTSMHSMQPSWNSFPCRMGRRWS